MSSQEEYTLIYWPLAGRGEFVRVMFEELKIPYKEISDIHTVTKVLKDLNESEFPHFAPPILKKGRIQHSV